MSRILNGKADPRLSTLEKIAKSLNVNLANFYFLPKSSAYKEITTKIWYGDLKVAEVDGTQIYSVENNIRKKKKKGEAF